MRMMMRLWNEWQLQALCMKASLAFARKGGCSGRKDFVLLRGRLIRRRSGVALLMQRMWWILRNKRQTNKQASTLSSLDILTPVRSNRSGFIAAMKARKMVPREDFLHMQASLGTCSLTRTCRPESGFLTTIDYRPWWQVPYVLLPVSITYFVLVVYDICLSCLDLPNVYRELLEPSLIDRVLILKCPFNSYKPRPSTTLSLI